MSRETLLDSPALLALMRDEEQRSREAFQDAIEIFKTACKAIKDNVPPPPILTLFSLIDNLVSVIHVLKKRTQAITYPEGLSSFIDKYPYFAPSFPKPKRLEVAFFYVVCQHVLRLSRREGLEEIGAMRIYALKLMEAFPAKKSQPMRERNKKNGLIRVLKKMLLFHYVGCETQHNFSAFQAQEVRQGFAKVVELRNCKVSSLFDSLADLERKIQGVVSFLAGDTSVSVADIVATKGFANNAYESDELLCDLTVLPILRNVVKISRDDRLCAGMFHAITVLIKSGWSLVKAQGCLPFFKTVVDTLVSAPWEAPSVLNALIPLLQQERDLSKLKSALIGIAHLSRNWVFMDADLPKLLNGLLNHALPDEKCVQESKSYHKEIEEFLAVLDGHKLPKGMTQAMHHCGVALLEQGESVRRPKNPLVECRVLLSDNVPRTQHAPDKVFQ